MKKLSTKDQETKKVLEGIINRYKDDLNAEGEKGIKANNMTNTAKMKLANLLGETDTPIPTPKPSSSSGSDAISEALNSIQEALNLLEGGGSINEAEVKRIFNES